MLLFRSCGTYGMKVGQMSLQMIKMIFRTAHPLPRPLARLGTPSGLDLAAGRKLLRARLPNRGEHASIFAWPIGKPGRHFYLPASIGDSLAGNDRRACDKTLSTCRVRSDGKTHRDIPLCRWVGRWASNSSCRPRL